MRIQQVVYVRIQFKGPQAPHSTFFSTFDFHSRWRLSVTTQVDFRALMPQRSTTNHPPWVPFESRASERAHNVALEMSPGDWRYLASVKFADFRKFLRSETGDIAVQSL